MEPISQHIRERLVGVFVLFGFLLPLIVLGKLLKITLSDGDELRTMGYKQSTRVEPIRAVRGTIYDSQGRTLVINEARYDVYIKPKAKGFGQERNVLVKKLAKLIQKPEAFINRKIEVNPGAEAILIQKRISESQRQIIRSWKSVATELSEATITRRYIYGKANSHALGYVSNRAEGMVGMLGLELYYNKQLSGKDGRRLMQRDRLGRVRPVVGYEAVDPRHGESIKLSIDLGRQVILEQELQKGLEAYQAKWGTAIAIHPKTGEILAMASAPDFDPNETNKYPEYTQLNRAVNENYEPGSTFKMVTAVAAIDQAKISVYDKVETGNGTARFGRKIMVDDKAIGNATFADVIAFSSNVGTAKVAIGKVEADIFYQYARNFGFGQYTWIDLPREAKGLVPLPSSWSETSLPWMSTGYEINASPLQTVTAFAALGNECKLMQPFLVKNRFDAQGKVTWEMKPRVVREVCKPQTAKTLLPVFERVMEVGTAKRANILGLRIAGKTGTTKVSENKRYIEGKYRASFVGLFPADNPQVAMVVVVGEPANGFYGGDVAAPIFKNIAKRWIGLFPEVARKMSPPVQTIVNKSQIVPNVVGLPAVVVRNRLAALGIQATFPEGADMNMPVKSQNPQAGTAINNQEVVLEVYQRVNNAFRMPDVRGFSARQAMSWLSARGVQVRLRGRGVVRTQIPRPGHPLPNHAILEAR